MSCREGFMSPQTETKASVGFKAVPPEEAGAAVAAESSTGTWTTVWTDGLTSLDRYKGRCYHIKPVAGEESQFIAYVAYPLDLFEEGSVTNMFTSIVGNVFGFKALRALRLEDLRIPTAYVKTFQGPPHGIQVEKDKLNKYGRPLLGCTIKPKLGLSAKNYGRAVYECLRGGLDFTKDDENVNSQPFMRWRDRFVFCAEAIYKAQAETGEIKGHYLNATAGTCEEMMKRAVFARELGVPIVMHDYLTGGFTANTSLAHYCRDNGLLLHIHRAMHAVIDRQKNHGMHFRVLAKALRMSGGDHVHAGTVVGKLEGEREITLGFVDLLRDDYVEKDRSRGIYFTQDWVSLPGVLPVASGGIHVWHMPALTEIFGDDSVLQFGGGTLGHPWGNAPGAVANRVALEACVQARNEGRDLAREGNEIIREASKWSPELAAACEVWKEIKFEFPAMDTLGQENYMEKWRFNSILSKKELEHRCRLSKSMDSLGPIENTSESEDPNRNDRDKNIHSWNDSDSSSYSNVDHLFGVKDIQNFISDDTFLVRDSNGGGYSIYFDIENQIFEINKDRSFLSELESYFYSYRNSGYLNNGSKSEDPYYDRYMYDTQYSWNNHINSCIDSYLHSQIRIDTYIVSGRNNYSDSYIYSSVCGESGNSSESESSSIRTSTNGSDLNIRESANDLDVTQKYKHLWVQCENCYGLNYKKFCTWDPMDEDMVSLDPIEFHSEEEPYKDRIDSYQRKTGLTEAVQTGIGQLNGSGYDRFDRKEGIVCIFRWGFPGKNRRVFLRFLIKDIQSVRIEFKEGIYARRVLYMEIRGQGAIPLTRTDENFTPREIEQKAAELAYFLRVPIEVF
ncbi:hypothetical protein TEA_024123 [Camellia sinensis var. sinensis]|uniref:Photosystem I assembly protein Ycf4 n=1 Tax=Camellia sinensis var. sinensis TaxID=542762 RepID=A0A4V3WMU6_CAMSN|nr:hypothetical protein TEA_024123 [Camellia sinensis var. sinensis]